MIKSKKATSIIEAIVVLLIIVTGVTGMYNLFNRSSHLSNSINNKIQAIQIAKQGIEAMTNIRDTNWIRFSSDYKNCWNTDINLHTVSNNCLGENNTNYDIHSGSYIVFRNNNNSWNLKSKNIDKFGSGTYIDDYRVYLDNGIYTQTGLLDNLYPIFTREVKVSYLKSNGISGDSNDPKMKIISLVQWVDSSSSTPHKVELEQTLSNWKEEN